jgi:hypothetical protein
MTAQYCQLKQFTLEALSVRLRTKPVGWKNNFIKKGREGKKFSWVGEKILSCKLWFQRCLVRLARVYFFSVLAFIIMLFVLQANLSK